MAGDLVANLPVDEVALLEDRARVVRRGALEVPAGVVRVHVDRIAPVAVDKTLTAVVVEGVAKVVDARIRRRSIVRGSGDGEAGQLALLEREREALEARIAAIQAGRDVTAREAGALEAAAQLTFADLAEDASWGRETGLEWVQRLDALRQAAEEAGERVIRGDREIGELTRLRQRLGERIRALGHPGTEMRADLDVDVIAEAAGRVVLRVEYTVPGACWRPYHTARLVPGATARVEVATDACVWQNTGEDWENAQLAFSTERASLGIDPPRLTSDLLGWQRRSDAIVVEARDQTVDTAGLGQGAPAKAAELPGIDDGGEPVALRATTRASIPSDGRPWRVRLTSFESEAELSLVAFPELVPAVITRSIQVNRGTQPLLAGPVDLLRDSGLVGRTSVLFTAPGERFELGWGPEPDLRIHRQAESSDEKSRTLSAWHTRTQVITNRLSNLGSMTRRVTITERVPVSELEKVKVEADAARTTNNERPDRDGFVRWRVDLGPRDHAKVELVYTIKRHESVAGL